MIILEEIFKWHLEAFASELFICSQQMRSSLCSETQPLLHSVDIYKEGFHYKEWRRSQVI